MAIGFDGHHVGARLGQGQGEGPETRPDLEHMCAGSGARKARNATDRVRVSDEVLPQGPAGLETVVRQQLCDVGAGKGHQEIVTSTTPWLRPPICENPEGDMSTTRG
jgi:hypothetical protein